jgi:hypothetical protein
MLYLGHFSFDQFGGQNESRHGYFTCLLEAENADSAANAVKAYILMLKETEDLFDGIVAVYIEDIVEIHKTPANPVIIRFQSSEGRFPKSITRSLPIIDNPDIILYGLASDVDGVKKRDSGDYTEATPFVEFPQKSFI